MLQKRKQTMKTTKYTYAQTIIYTKLEIWDRAQHEAARRPKSDWKYNLWG